MQEIAGLNIHPAHKSGLVPAQCGGLYYHNAYRGFFVARGAHKLQFQTSKGTGYIFYNQKFILGLLKPHEATWPRVMTLEELKASVAWLQDKAKEQKAAA